MQQRVQGRRCCSLQGMVMEQPSTHLLLLLTAMHPVQETRMQLNKLSHQHGYLYLRHPKRFFFVCQGNLALNSCGIAQADNNNQPFSTNC